MSESISINTGTQSYYNGHIVSEHIDIACCDYLDYYSNSWLTFDGGAYYLRLSDNMYDFDNWFDIPQLKFKENIEKKANFSYTLTNGVVLHFDYKNGGESSDVGGSFNYYLYEIWFYNLNGKCEYLSTADYNQHTCIKIYKTISKPFFAIGIVKYYNANPTELEWGAFKETVVMSFALGDGADIKSRLIMGISYNNYLYAKYPKMFSYCYLGVYNGADVFTQDARQKCTYESLFTPMGNVDKLPSGGSGSGNRPSNATNITLPSFDVLSTGALTTYKLNASDVQELFNYLWSTDFDTASKKLYSNPIDSIISLQMIPANVTGVATTLKIAGTTVTADGSQVSAIKINSQYIQYEFTPFKLSECFGNFLDYEPYTSIEMYIPYSGIHTLNTNEVMGKNLTCGYMIDVVSGMAIAYIKTEMNGAMCIIGNYPCQIAYSIPLSGANMDNIVTTTNSINTANKNASAQTVGNVASAVAGGNVTGAISTAINSTVSLVQTANNNELAKQNMSKGVDHAGNLNGNTGIISVRTPYLILKRPDANIPSSYNHSKGRPCNISQYLKNVTGYTVVDNIDLTSISATTEELNEIMTMLKSGVYL